MKILAPIDNIKEAPALIKAGADEFYCGVLIDGINVSSTRTNLHGVKESNIPDLPHLERLIKLLKSYHKSVFVALNHPALYGVSVETVVKNLTVIKNMGVAGLIIGDLNLLNSANSCGLKMIASSYFETKNQETVDFLFKNFNVKRIILDRQITLDDLRIITTQFPQVEFESFVMASSCKSLASACRNSLILKDRIKKSGVHLCDTVSIVNNRGKAEKISDKEREIISGRLQRPHNACGVCALWHFKMHNITSVKIVGRGFPNMRKVKNVEFVKKALLLLEDSNGQEEYYEKAENLFIEVFGKKCYRQYCYYPHFFQKS